LVGQAVQILRGGGVIIYPTDSCYALGLDLVRFIPAALPPHRADSPHASEYHRLEMVSRALADARAGDHRWEVSDQELRRAGPSYTIDTLEASHAEGLIPLQLVFITGADAFAEIATWHCYPHVLDAAHFAVIARPGTSVESLRVRLPSLAARMIRPDQFAAAEGTRIVLIDRPTPPVSATEIRQRARRGESLDGLVTPSVAAYIAEHSLYRSASAAPVHRT
ncbi:MAG: nicotinate (nicotinamide) nucleotide adenylyltransferase, partial [Gemmatimonadetes bacterium]|nr:nicotinate (nicotinamide) nucleotide adenylyltransferase [Gemmatimonadota bacterium]